MVCRLSFAVTVQDVIIYDEANFGRQIVEAELLFERAVVLR